MRPTVTSFGSSTPVVINNGARHRPDKRQNEDTRVNAAMPNGLGS
jgi:hypothetical protein